MTLLLHACCGPCLGGLLSEPLGLGENQMVAYWDNPNIHPYLEFFTRFNSFLKFVQENKIPYLVPARDGHPPLRGGAQNLDQQSFTDGTDLAGPGPEGYGLERFLKALAGDYGPSRCRVCFSLRLGATAAKAREIGAEAFSTTLLISPYQNHELLAEIGTSIGKRVGIPFAYKDFRPRFRKTYEVSRKSDLYRQKYCGCVFSEQERYAGDKKLDRTRMETFDKHPIDSKQGNPA